MKKLLFAVAVLASALTACGRKAAVDTDAPLTVIIETDLGNDVDDALALDLLYKYQDAGKIRLLAVNLSKNGQAPAIRTLRSELSGTGLTVRPMPSITPRPW